MIDYKWRCHVDVKSETHALSSLNHFMGIESDDVPVVRRLPSRAYPYSLWRHRSVKCSTLEKEIQESLEIIRTREDVIRQNGLAVAIVIVIAALRDEQHDPHFDLTPDEIALLSRVGASLSVETDYS